MFTLEIYRVIAASLPAKNIEQVLFLDYVQYTCKMRNKIM